MVLVTDDVGEELPLVLRLLDEPDGDPRDGARDRHAGGHQGEGRTAHRGHRARAVGLKDVGEHPDCVRENIGSGEHRLDAPLSESAVADLAPAGAADRADLADGERRKVVVEHELLRILVEESVNTLLVLACPEGDRH